VHSTGDNIQAEMERHLGWVHRLRMALEERRFRLYSQSIACLKGEGEDEHVELLLRLEEGGTLVPPGAFIPAAERFGMMPQIDRFVVGTALDSIRDAKASKHGTYAINLSGPTLGDTGFLPFLLHELDRTGVSPLSLCFEITETSAIENLDAAIIFMEAMRARGCRFALDDFGVGMSSLSYLKRLPIDFLKIDGSFVRDMLTDPQSHAMVKMINEVAHIAGLQTIAEFAESEAIIAALTDLGVDYAQGYAVQRPIPFGADRQPTRATA
jgi:EAL domain-containing protein (putative c-di-GMP-specific phosphodiesterase class I)